MKAKYFMLRCVCLLLLALYGGAAWAYDFESDGLCYNILSEGSEEENGTVEVTYQNFADNYVTGDLVIPSCVTYEGKTYNVEVIGHSAFDGCSSLTSVKIPNGVTRIDEWAFRRCSSLASVVIGDDVMDIGNQAFYECYALTSLKMGNGVSVIGYEAFYHCGLTSVTIPNSVSEIGYGAFYFCTALTFVEIGDGCIRIWDRAFYYCTALTSVEMGNNVMEIGAEAFRLTALTSVKIPNSVVTIGDSAFYDCDALTAVEIGNSVTTIGDKAFYNCHALSSVEIGNSVASIGDAAFYNCSSLTSVEIPNSVTTIGDGAFAGSSLTSVEIPNSVTTIGDGAFAGSSLTSVEIPNSVTSIGNDAFRECFSLSSVTIPSSVTAIGNNAFYNCSSLASLEIPNSVTTIGNEAFENCSSLISVTIPGSVTTIGDNAFFWCYSLKNINVDPLNQYYTSVDGVLYTIHKDMLIVCPMTKASVEIPNSVITIEDWAFNGCSALTSVVIPNSVTEIGEGAFQSCRALISVEVGNSVTKIGERAFSGCDALASVEIPNSVTEIGEGAFQGCSALTSVKIPNGVTTIGFGTFEFCSSLTSVEIPSSVTSIGERAFQDCSALTSVTIPNSVTVIGNRAFAMCPSLVSVMIPNSVTTIGDDAFYNCAALASVEIGSGVTTVGSYAFYGCGLLRSIYCRMAEPIECNPSFPEDVLQYATLYVPTGTKAAYEEVAPWSNFSNIVEEGTLLSGVWTSAELASTLGLADWDPATATELDLRSVGAQLAAGFTVDNTDGNPNLLVYTDTEITAENAISVVDGALSGSETVLTDLRDFSLKEDVSGDVSYVRSFSGVDAETAGGWSVICLPFTVAEVTDAKGNKYIPYSEWIGTEFPDVGFFWLKQATGGENAINTDAGTIEANVPYLIAFPNYDYDDHPLLRVAENTEFTFSGSGLSATVDVAPADMEQWEYHANYRTAAVSNEYVLNADGSAFVLGEGQLSPFRPYVTYKETSAVQNAPRLFPIGADNTPSRLLEVAFPDKPASDLRIEVSDGEVRLTALQETRVLIHSAGGLLLREFMLRSGESRTVSLQPGIYLVNKQKVIVSENR